MGWIHLTFAWHFKGGVISVCRPTHDPQGKRKEQKICYCSVAIAISVLPNRSVTMATTTLDKGWCWNIHQTNIQTEKQSQIIYTHWPISIYIGTDTLLDKDTLALIHEVTSNHSTKTGDKAEKTTTQNKWLNTHCPQSP